VGGGGGEGERRGREQVDNQGRLQGPDAPPEGDDAAARGPDSQRQQNQADPRHSFAPSTEASAA